MPARHATVTALRSSGRGRVAVELDGGPWRTLPLEAVVRAGLAVGATLDRERARILARERRRLAALAAATGALRRRDMSRRALDERLAQRGIAPAERRRTVETLGRAGFVDDERFARSRAEALANRGYGDAFIADDLERRGVEAAAIRAALESLDPESERAFAELERRGGGPRAARALARRGFATESLEHVVARQWPAELG